MVTIEYSSGDFETVAWPAIKRGEAVDVIVRGWRVVILRRSLPLWEIFFGPRRRAHSWGELWRIGLYGWMTVWLLGTYNHAVSKGMTVSWREAADSVVISFRP